MYSSFGGTLFCTLMYGWHFWPAHPDDPQGIRVASGFEFSVCVFVCLFVCLFWANFLIFFCSINKLENFRRTENREQRTDRQRFQLQRPLLSPVDRRGERANKTRSTITSSRVVIEQTGYKRNGIKLVGWIYYIVRNSTVSGCTSH